jgi:hypothetical protein
MESFKKCRVIELKHLFSNSKKERKGVWLKAIVNIGKEKGNMMESRKRGGGHC